MRGDRRARPIGGRAGVGARTGARAQHSRRRALIRELSLAQAIVDVATRHAQGRTVTAIELRVGRERLVAPAGLDFAFSLLTEGTSLDGAELEIEHVSGGELAVDALRLQDAR